MKTIRFLGMTLLLVITFAGFYSCGHEDKNYFITFNANSATIYQHGPRQCEKEEKEIFDELQSSKYNGQYTIYYCSVKINEYGEKDYGEPFKLIIIDATKLKSVQYKYFKGTIATPLSNLYSIH